MDKDKAMSLINISIKSISDKSSGSMISDGAAAMIMPIDMTRPMITTNERKSIFSRLLFPKKRKYSTSEFFGLIKKGYSQTTDELSIRYALAIVAEIQNASNLGQHKLKKSLEHHLLGFKQEISMIKKTGIISYLEENDIADIVDIGIEGKDIIMCSMSDYEKIIPVDISEKIIQIKALDVFDSIQILYTSKKSRRMKLDRSRSSSSRNKKVDPIAFGKIDNLNRYYPIVDRMDDECRFTIKSIEDKVKQFALVSE